MQIFFNTFNTNYTNTNFKAKKLILVRGTKLTEAQIKRNSRNEIILKMLSKGFSKAEIAEKLKITVRTIFNFLKSKAVLITSDSYKQRIIERIKNGETVEYIIKEEGIAKKDLDSIAKSANLETITNFQKNKQERDKLILEKLKKGSTTKEVAREFNVSLGLVLKIAQEAKVIAQSRRERNLRIIEKLNNGVSIEQVAQEENLAIETVKRIKQKAIKSGIIKTTKEKRNLRIINAYKAGDNISQIAEKENLSIVSIKRILDESGIQYISDFQKKKMSKEKQILELLMQGFSRKDIAEILKVEIYKINQVAEENNVVQTLILERTNRIVEKLKKGYSTKKIAEEEGINVVTVTRTAHKENITLPSQKESAKRRAAIIEDLKNGVKIADIAKKHNVSTVFVGIIKKEIGLTKKYNYSGKVSEIKSNEIKD